MPKQKRDYQDLKKKFMASKFTDVKGFIVDRWMTYNSCIRKNTKWWAEEKKELKVRASNTSIKSAETKLARQLEPSTELLLWNINKAIELSGRKLEQMAEKDVISAKDLSTIWSMNRIQNWQPTTYVKEEQNVNQNVVLKAIHIVLWPDVIDNGENNENNEK